jgi:hypothetical protein
LELVSQKKKKMSNTKHYPLVLLIPSSKSLLIIHGSFQLLLQTLHTLVPIVLQEDIFPNLGIDFSTIMSFTSPILPLQYWHMLLHLQHVCEFYVFLFLYWLMGLHLFTNTCFLLFKTCILIFQDSKQVVHNWN